MTNILLYINRNIRIPCQLNLSEPSIDTSNILVPEKTSLYLLYDNFLSEYNTLEEKRLIMLNILLFDNIPKENSEKLVDSGTVYKVMREGKLGRDQLTELFNYLQRTKADKSELFSKDYRELTNTPKNLSDFNNDLNFVQILDLENYYDKNEIDNIILNISLDNIDLSGYATQEYVLNQINNLIDGAPEALDTLKEITDKLSADDDVVNLILNLISQKADKSDIEILDIDTNGHEYVDLGLPSGTLWATMNVGATSETDYGNYYQYGKGANLYLNTYNQSNYSGIENPLDLSVDTARQEWGGQWHTPTKELLEELINNTTYEWIANYKNSGINGGTFTATNGAVLFFPAAGNWGNGSLYNVGNFGNYWGSSPYTSTLAYYLRFSLSINDVSNFNHKYGYSVRPVIDSSVKISLKDKVLQLEQNLATVATTGSYNDLLDLPTNISSFTNDVGYLTSHLDISGKAENSDLLQTNELVQQLLNKILLLESKLENIKHEILTQEMYDNLQQYDPYTVYFIVEQLPPTPVDKDYWAFGDGFPVIFSKNKWRFGLGFPIIFSERWTFGDEFPIILGPGQESLEEEPLIDDNGYEYVDLGLPSGTLWAKYNVGALTETEYGNYYMYGKGENLYDYYDSIYEGTENPLNSLVDTATQTMGSSWHTPTQAQIQELIDNTTYTFETNFNDSDINGGKFTAQNGNYIFLPAAGSMLFEVLFDLNKYGYYWSSTLGDLEYAYKLSFDNTYGVSCGRFYISRGFSIRGVLDNNN